MQKNKASSLTLYPSTNWAGKNKCQTGYTNVWSLEFNQKTADNLLQKTQLNKIDYLALSFLMTDEKKYADKIKEILLDVTEDETWGNQEMMARTPAWTPTWDCT